MFSRWAGPSGGGGRVLSASYDITDNVPWTVATLKNNWSPSLRCPIDDDLPGSSPLLLLEPPLVFFFRVELFSSHHGPRCNVHISTASRPIMPDYKLFVGGVR